MKLTNPDHRGRLPFIPESIRLVSVPASLTDIVRMFESNVAEKVSIASIVFGRDDLLVIERDGAYMNVVGVFDKMNPEYGPPVKQLRSRFGTVAEYRFLWDTGLIRELIGNRPIKAIYSSGFVGELSDPVSLSQLHNVRKIACSGDKCIVVVTEPIDAEATIVEPYEFRLGDALVEIELSDQVSPLQLIQDSGDYIPFVYDFQNELLFLPLDVEALRKYVVTDIHVDDLLPSVFDFYMRSFYIEAKGSSVIRELLKGLTISEVRIANKHFEPAIVLEVPHDPIMASIDAFSVDSFRLPIDLAYVEIEKDHISPIVSVYNKGVGVTLKASFAEQLRSDIVRAADLNYDLGPYFVVRVSNLGGLSDIIKRVSLDDFFSVLRKDDGGFFIEFVIPRSDDLYSLIVSKIFSIETSPGIDYSIPNKYPDSHGTVVEFASSSPFLYKQADSPFESYIDHNQDGAWTAPAPLKDDSPAIDIGEDVSYLPIGGPSEEEENLEELIRKLNEAILRTEYESSREKFELALNTIRNKAKETAQELFSSLREMIARAGKHIERSDGMCLTFSENLLNKKLCIEYGVKDMEPVIVLKGELRTKDPIMDIRSVISTEIQLPLNTPYEEDYRVKAFLRRFL